MEKKIKLYDYVKYNNECYQVCEIFKIKEIVSIINLETNFVITGVSIHELEKISKVTLNQRLFNSYWIRGRRHRKNKKHLKEYFVKLLDLEKIGAIIST